MQTTRPQTLDSLRLLEWLMLVALIFILLFLSKAHYLPPSLPHRGLVNAVLMVPGLVLLTGCFFMSLFALFTGALQRWKGLLIGFVSTLFILLTFISFWWPYVIITRQIDRLDVGKLEEYERLPNYVDLTRSAPNQARRAVAARAAYIFYGISLPYRQDDMTWVYFTPTGDEIRDRQSTAHLDTSLVNLRLLSTGLLAGAVNVVYLFFATISVSLLWAGIRLAPTHNRPSPPSS